MVCKNQSKKEHFAVKSKLLALAHSSAQKSKKEHFAVKSKLVAIWFEIPLQSKEG